MQDRGTKKWTSLMLPEHQEMIQKLWAEDEYKEKPVLSEQQLEENEFILQEAIRDGSEIQIKYYNNHDFYFIRGSTIIENGNLVIKEATIKLDDIIEIKMV